MKRVVKNMALGRVGPHTRCCVEIVEENRVEYPWAPDGFMAAVLANRKARLGTEQGLEVHPAGSGAIDAASDALK